MHATGAQSGERKIYLIELPGANLGEWAGVRLRATRPLRDSATYDSTDRPMPSKATPDITPRNTNYVVFKTASLR